MSNIVSTIKKLVVETVKSMDLGDNIIGTVVSTKPLKISINEKMTLEEIHFYKLRSAIGSYPVLYKDGTGLCKHELKKGSKVVLSKCVGGEKYVILGELIE